MFDVEVVGLKSAVEVTFTAVSERGREVFAQAMGYGCVGITTLQADAVDTIVDMLKRGLVVGSK